MKIRSKRYATLLSFICAALFSWAPLHASTFVDVSCEDAILHLGSIDSFDVSEGGIAAAKIMLRAVENKDRKAALEAIDIYHKLIPDENFGGEYTALQWICRYLTADDNERHEMLKDPQVDAFHRFISDNDYANLKEYLNRKYHLAKYGDEDTIQAHQKEASLEDFILFNNPARESWEKTQMMLDSLGISKGMTIADIGSGPGYFTLMFSNKVGPDGKVHAIEVNPDHIKYIRETANRLGIKNIAPVQSKATDISLGDIKVDMAYMCSLYHIIYTVFEEKQRADFINGIKKALKPGGRLVIVDNGPVADDRLPYHGPYIARELIVGQLKHYGFKLIDTKQFIPQRYILTFVVDSESNEKNGEDAPVAKNTYRIEIKDKRSLLHIPNDLGARPMVAARKPAGLLLSALKTKNTNLALQAREMFVKLNESEKIGDEYSAYVWICDYLSASESKKNAMRSDKLHNSYIEMLSKDDFQVLKDYLTVRYYLNGENDVPVSELTGAARAVLEDNPSKNETEKNKLGQGSTAKPQNTDRPKTSGVVSTDSNNDSKSEQAEPSGNEFISINDSLAVQFLNKGRDLRPEILKRMSAERQVFWRDFILFNNPNRSQWEKSELILQNLSLKNGEHIADLGCGSGYYSVAFSKLVGKEGKVYSTDTNVAHLEYVRKLAGEMGLENISTIEGKLDNSMLPEEKLDKVFMCSLFSPVYTTGMNKVTHKFIQSIRKSLKKNGRLIIVDNDVVDSGIQPYHGPFIANEIIEANLGFQGFRLIETHQIIPQRYMMVFELSENKN
jgi:ubiquinone/menaquinone biosynthesis C-methylase UbiE